MYQFKVGGYLFGEPRRISEGCTLTYDASGPALLISLAGIKDKEVRKLKKGKMEFAVFEQEGILFLLVDVPGVIDWSDAPFHIGLYRDGRQAPDSIPDGQGWGLTILGLEAKTGQIKSMRFIGLGTEISREMLMIIQAQGLINQVDYHNKIKQIYRKYSCEQMLAKSAARYKVGETI